MPCRPLLLDRLARPLERLVPITDHQLAQLGRSSAPVLRRSPRQLGVRDQPVSGLDRHLLRAVASNLVRVSIDACFCARILLDDNSEAHQRAKGERSGDDVREFGCLAVLPLPRLRRGGAKGKVLVGLHHSKTPGESNTHLELFHHGADVFVPVCLGCIDSLRARQDSQSGSSRFLLGPGLAERGEEDTGLTWKSRLSPYAAANSSATTWTNCSWSTAAEHSRRFLTGEGTDATPLVTIESYSDIAREREGKGTFFFVSPESEDAHTDRKSVV